MNPLLEQRIELLVEQGDVEELMELFAKSVDLGKEGVKIRAAVDSRVHLLDVHYGLEKKHDSFRSFMKDYDFYFSPLRDIATVHDKTLYYLPTKGMPYTLAEFIDLFRRGGFEKCVIFPFEIYAYQAMLPIGWDEETRTTVDFNYDTNLNLDWEDFSSVGLYAPDVSYHFLRKGDELIIEKYSAATMWNEDIEGPSYEPPQLLTSVRTDFKSYRGGRFREKLYNEIDEKYFSKKAVLDMEGTDLGVYDRLKEPADAVPIAFDLLSSEDSTRVAIPPNWNYYSYWVAYYLNEETIRVREMSLNDPFRPDDEQSTHIIDLRVPNEDLPIEAFPSYCQMFYRCNEEPVLRSVELKSLAGKNYRLADVKPHFLVCDEPLQDTEELKIIEEYKEASTGTYAYRITLH